LASCPALDLRFAQVTDPPLDELLHAALDDFQPIAIQEHDAGDGWLVFFRSAERRDAAAGALAPYVSNESLTLRPIDVPDEDWARKSQAKLTAVTVGRITVAPPWDLPNRSVATPDGIRDPGSEIRTPRFVTRNPPAAPGSRIPDPDEGSADPGSRIPDPVPDRGSPDPGSRIPDPVSDRGSPDPGSRIPDPVSDQILIVIDPSMGFGTGHHQTTRLCLALLQSIDLTGRRVIDVGTGSGVLAIAAAKLGARSVVAMDNDPDAVQNARENVERNRARVEIVCTDLATFAASPADIVTANLTAAVLVNHAAAVRRLVVPEGSLIVSGLSPEELPDVAAALGGALADRLVDGEWCAALVAFGGSQPTGA
jgi:ribosomal protein L11 methylase PrmA